MGLEATLRFAPEGGFDLRVPGKAPSKGSFKVVSARGNREKSILLSQTPGPMAEFDGRLRFLLGMEWDRAVTPEWEKVVRDRGFIHVTYRAMVKRPQSHYFRPRGSSEIRLKPDAPEYPAYQPDMDKFQRAVNDSMVKCGIIPDDRFIVAGCFARLWSPDRQDWIWISVRPMGTTTADTGSRGAEIEEPGSASHG